MKTNKTNNQFTKLFAHGTAIGFKCTYDFQTGEAKAVAYPIIKGVKQTIELRYPILNIRKKTDPEGIDAFASSIFDRISVVEQTTNKVVVKIGNHTMETYYALQNASDGTVTPVFSVRLDDKMAIRGMVDSRYRISGKVTAYKANGEMVKVAAATSTKIDPFLWKTEAEKLDMLGDVHPMYHPIVVDTTRTDIEIGDREEVVA